MKSEQLPAIVKLKNEYLKRNAELLRAIRGRTEPEAVRRIREVVNALRSEIIEAEMAVGDRQTVLPGSVGYLSTGFPERY